MNCTFLSVEYIIINIKYKSRDEINITIMQVLNHYIAKLKQNLCSYINNNSKERKI